MSCASATRGDERLCRRGTPRTSPGLRVPGVSLRGPWQAQVSPRDAFHFRNGVVGQMHCGVRLPNSLLVGARHKAKGFPRLQVNVGGVRPHVKLHRCRFQRIELIQELLFREGTLGETALRLVVGVDEVFHGETPVLEIYLVVHIHDLRYTHTLSCRLAHVHLLLDRPGTPRMARAPIPGTPYAIWPSASRLWWTLAHCDSPSWRWSRAWARAQSGNASRTRARPRSVISTVRLRCQPSRPTTSNPSLTSGRTFRVSVERSIPKACASAVMDTAPSVATATKTANWVARRPTGRSAASYARVTARAAMRTLWHTQLSTTSRSVVILLLPRLSCIYTTC